MEPVLSHSARCLIASALAVLPSLSHDLLLAWTWKQAKERRGGKGRKRKDAKGRKKEGKGNERLRKKERK